MKPFADRVSKLRQAPNTRVGQGVDPSIAETTTMAKAPVVAFGDTIDEGTPAVVQRLIEFEAEKAFDESIR